MGAVSHESTQQECSSDAPKHNFSVEKCTGLATGMQHRGSELAGGGHVVRITVFQCLWSQMSSN